jgi:hypothetical protein
LTAREAGLSGRPQTGHPTEAGEALFHVVSATIRTNLGVILEEASDENLKLLAARAAT